MKNPVISKILKIYTKDYIFTRFKSVLYWEIFKNSVETNGIRLWIVSNVIGSHRKVNTFSPKCLRFVSELWATCNWKQLPPFSYDTLFVFDLHEYKHHGYYPVSQESILCLLGYVYPTDQSLARNYMEKLPFGTNMINHGILDFYLCGWTNRMSDAV